ncbi:MAG: glycosyltransferase [Allomuricauda sp.]
MNHRLLVIGHVWPEPRTTAAGQRMLQLLRAFLDFGYDITFASTAVKTEHSHELENMGIAVAPIELNHSSFDQFVQQLDPAVVVFDRFMIEEQFGWRVAEFAPQALRILNTEDLHALRKAREEAHNQHETFTLAHWKNHPMALREVASIYRSDVALMISSFEMDILEQELGIPKSLLLHLPFMLDFIVEEDQSKWPNFEERKHFICVGNGKHAPNVDSVAILKSGIWPLIKKELPDAKLFVYGAYLPKHIEALHSPKEGFYVEGWFDDLDTVLQNARLLLAPLQFGAGIKGKLLDAMKNGTPSITTSVGAEGMHANLPWNGAICDVWPDFAHAAVELYLNKTSWQKAQTNGIALINSLYNKQSLQNRLQQKMEAVQQHLQDHRNQNFMGRLLQHHTLVSTKYLAKWIEEKNKR